MKAGRTIITIMEVLILTHSKKKKMTRIPELISNFYCWKSACWVTVEAWSLRDLCFKQVKMASRQECLLKQALTIWVSVRDIVHNFAGKTQILIRCRNLDHVTSRSSGLANLSVLARINKLRSVVIDVVNCDCDLKK